MCVCACRCVGFLTNDHKLSKELNLTARQAATQGYHHIILLILLTQPPSERRTSVVLGPLLFVLYINDIDDWTLSKICKFADDRELCRAVGEILGKCPCESTN